MAYIGEFDERRAWAVPGVLSCAHWLCWRLGMGQNAAGERVRVARALRRLPATSAAFAAGRLSFTQVRAISRVATGGDEQDYIAMARHATGGQLERLVSGVRRARKLHQRRKAAEAAAAAGEPPPVAERIRVFSRYDGDGDLHITIRAGAADGAVLLAAIDAAAPTSTAIRDPERGNNVSPTSALLLTNRHYVYETRSGDDALLVALNLDDEPLSVAVRARVEAGSSAPPQEVVDEVVVELHGWRILSRA